MEPYLEIWRRSGREVAVLGGEAVTIGRGQQTAVRLADDAEVSRLHAVIEKVRGEVAELCNTFNPYAGFTTL